MRILLTNDDGLRAPGIEALYDALVDRESGFGGPVLGQDTDIVPIAPLTVQSATSHGVTFHQPLMTEDIRVNDRMRGIAVDGRPADCVKLALCNLWPERFGPGSRPDLVISGMNAGANCGINVIYSGTVAAALEAAFLGVPSIAVSLMIGPGTPDFAAGAAQARHAIDLVIARGLPDAHECLNINIPVMEEGRAGNERPLPVRICPMNTHGLVDSYERRVSPSGKPYYWATGHGLDFRETDAGTDVHGLMGRCVTITPLHYDLTAHTALDRWEDRLGSG